MSSPGIIAQDAATLLARANGRLQMMIARRTLSRAGIREALALSERACNAMRLITEERSNEQAREAARSS